MKHITPGRPNQFTDSELTMIWIRYHLWYHNRPAAIADEYGVSRAYISQIGRRATPCQPQLRPNQYKRSRLTSTPPMSQGSNAGSAQAGRPASENSSEVTATNE